MLTHSVNAQGAFKVTPEQCRENHCGITPSTITFDVRVEGPLDARGFVVDVRGIHAYFRYRYETYAQPVPSCEQVCADAIEYFTYRVPALTRVRVKIRASALGYAETVWDAPKARARVKRG